MGEDEQPASSVFENKEDGKNRTKEGRLIMPTSKKPKELSPFDVFVKINFLLVFWDACLREVIKSKSTEHFLQLSDKVFGGFIELLDIAIDAWEDETCWTLATIAYVRDVMGGALFVSGKCLSNEYLIGELKVIKQFCLDIRTKDSHPLTSLEDHIVTFLFSFFGGLSQISKDHLPDYYKHKKTKLTEAGAHNLFCALVVDRVVEVLMKEKPFSVACIEEEGTMTLVEGGVKGATEEWFAVHYPQFFGEKKAEQRRKEFQELEKKSK
jgi:hypothetical protein